LDGRDWKAAVKSHLLKNSEFHRTFVKYHGPVPDEYLMSDRTVAAAPTTIDPTLLSERIDAAVREVTRSLLPSAESGSSSSSAPEDDTVLPSLGDWRREIGPEAISVRSIHINAINDLMALPQTTINTFLNSSSTSAESIKNITLIELAKSMNVHFTATKDKIKTTILEFLVEMKNSKLIDAGTPPSHFVMFLSVYKGIEERIIALTVLARIASSSQFDFLKTASHNGFYLEAKDFKRSGENSREDNWNEWKKLASTATILMSNFRVLKDPRKFKLIPDFQALDAGRVGIEYHLVVENESSPSLSPSSTTVAMMDLTETNTTTETPSSSSVAISEEVTNLIQSNRILTQQKTDLERQLQEAETKLAEVKTQSDKLQKDLDVSRGTRLKDLTMEQLHTALDFNRAARMAIKDAIKEASLCSICLEAAAKVIYLPCKHQTTCMSCYDALVADKASLRGYGVDRRAQCPKCRQPIDDCFEPFC
jgi:hypothetical protein